MKTIVLNQIICRALLGDGLARTVSLEMVYNRINRLEDKVSILEKRLVPEIKISKKETAELEKIRQESETMKQFQRKNYFRFFQSNILVL
jgi:hypothetical protein